MLLKFIQRVAPAILNVCSASLLPVGPALELVAMDGVPIPIKGQPVTLVRRFAKVGRNESCPCGSGDKYKKCCG